MYFNDYLWGEMLVETFVDKYNSIITAVLWLWFKDKTELFLVLL